MITPLALSLPVLSLVEGSNGAPMVRQVTMSGTHRDAYYYG